MAGEVHSALHIQCLHGSSKTVWCFIFIVLHCKRPGQESRTQYAP